MEFTGQGRRDPILAGVAEAWKGLPQRYVSPTGRTDSALLVRVYLLLQAYATLRFRAQGKWLEISRIWVGSSPVPLGHASGWWIQRDSNPCFSLEGGDVAYYDAYLRGR